ncbi:hypothetical protein LYSHEL_14660 [Lysobacter helvus]|uniref:Uncharacterized protein n=2 Tax=Lysobacteraceae TaxID=32033 RepID=A0ABM7Q5B2_9GAMM|nr:MULTISPECIES: hypothetical protein [Lysobacter]BCT92442.1 hypothetical protein LYSCAS_14660 [Lysobacter caseinilyticus]BCT95595.1 hypothetical protein LYSHEL_14660 [Lysobacter helvus]
MKLRIRPALVLGLGLIAVAKGLSVAFDAPWVYWVGAFKGVVICLVDLVRASDRQLRK